MSSCGTSSAVPQPGIENDSQGLSSSTSSRKNSSRNLCDAIRRESTVNNEWDESKMFVCAPVGCRSVGGSLVVAKVQTEEQLANWKVKVRKKALRQKRLAKLRNERAARRVKEPIKPLELPSDALRWRGEPWRQHRQEMARIQQGIYQAAVEEDWIVVRTLQNALMTSQAAKSLAVRRVSLTHPQRRIPGVDGEHTLDEQRQRSLRDALDIDGQADALRMIRVSRAWKDMRSDGNSDGGLDAEEENVCVCTMRDRAKQVLLSWALEPEFESFFARSNLFSDRPGRSVQDFLQWLTSTLHNHPAHVFGVQMSVRSPDKVSEFLRTCLADDVAKQVGSWMDSGLFQLGMFPVGIGRHAEEQTCPILPLLSNLVCHHVTKDLQEQRSTVQTALWNGTLIAVAPYSEDLTRVQERLSATAASIGLEAEVTIPVAAANQEWISFREFIFKQESLYSVDVCFLTIRPRDGVLEQHLQNLTTAFRLSRHFHEDKSGLINRLNPIVQAFTEHFCMTDAVGQFEGADAHLKALLFTWTLRNNTTLLAQEALEKEFGGTQNSDLGFEFRTRIVRLLKHGDVVRQCRLPQVDKDKSPYDGDRAYWDRRLKHWEYSLCPSFV